MNLAIIEKDINSHNETGRLKSSKCMMKINGEYLIERIIRIARVNGITKVICIIKSHEPELKNYLLKNNFGIPTKLITPDPRNYMYYLFALASAQNKEPFFFANTNSTFLENDFSEFVTYSLLQEDADGVIAVTKNINDEKPLCVAMNDEDIILKFSNSKEGYSWVNGGIYYFTPKIFSEAKYAVEAGLSGIEKFLQLLIVRGNILKGFSFSKIVKIENTADIVKAEDLITGNK